jgi:HAD superfamily hydrolase (TIGR01509 family)
MDGTLVDSEPLWHRAETALVAAHGHTLDAEVRDQLAGVATEAAMALLRERYRIGVDVATLAADLEARMLALLPQAQAKPGAAELLAWAARSGLRFALVSNSSHAVIEGALAGRPWAEPIAPERRFSADDVTFGKPAPDLYLHAARSLGVDPAGCLVVEDTETGVRAARAAGMTCWAVPEPHADPEAFRPLTPHLFTGLPEVLAALQRIVPG